MKPTISEREVAGRGLRFSVMQDNKEVGRAFLYVLNNDLHKEPFGFLEDVFIDESLRGQGIGSTLMRQVLDAARREGCYKIVAGSRHERPAVHEFYKRLGFSDHGLEFRMDLSSPH